MSVVLCFVVKSLSCGLSCCLALCRPGSDLLSRVLRRSTIGAGEFHGRVRDGIGCISPRHDHQAGEGQELGFPVLGWLSVEDWSLAAFESRIVFWFVLFVHLDGWTGIMRAIKPIELLVPVSFTHCCASTPGLSTWWSSTALIGSTGFEVRFPLRCLQRLSSPYVATLQCGWRHNRSTRGMSIPVLSY